MSRRAAIAALAAAGALAPSLAAAHSYSVAHSDVHIAGDRRSATYALRINVADLGEPMALAADHVPSDGDITAAAPALVTYATERIRLESGGRPCRPQPLGVTVVEQTDRFAEIRWRCEWPEPIEVFAVDYDLFFDVDPNHTGMLKVTLGDERATTPLIADASRFEWELGEPPPSGLLGFVRSGIDHIFYGPDHILFLLGLLAVAALAGLRSTLAIVTSFTVAHSITLIAAALGWISLPTRFVESAIAASIVYVAVENLIVAAPSRRWLLTFAFGLVHGIGFATMLSPLLPESQVVAPLLAFNVGVEIGQLAIVAAAFPLLRLATRKLPLARYRRVVVIPGSIAVGLVGLLWLIERAFAVAIL